MSSAIRITQWRMAGFKEIRQSPGVLRLVEEVADAVAAECGDGFVASPRIGRTRARALVYPDTRTARAVERRQARLLTVATRRGMKIGGSR